MVIPFTAICKAIQANIEGFAFITDNAGMLGYVFFAKIAMDFIRDEEEVL